MGLLRSLSRFWRRSDGSVATIAALGIPVLLLASGVATEYVSITSQQGKPQAAADAAVLAGARELRFANADLRAVINTTTRFARTQILSQFGTDGSDVRPAIDPARTAVEVVITRPYAAVFGLSFLSTPSQLQVRAVGKVGSGVPICLIGLETGQPHAVWLKTRARLTAPGCAVYSNSTHTQGLVGLNFANLSAQVICSSGGKVGTKANFTPDPITNCPQLRDPLAARPPPYVGGCNQTNMVISGINTTLRPGVYCGGLKITRGAHVRLAPGKYVIKDGPLWVDGDASLSGTYVGFYLSGKASVINFAARSTISLSAPRDGALASLLFFEDRSAPIGRRHLISSDDARMLLGTIYLPNGRLKVDANKPVADQSAYTIIVARFMELDAGPNLIMNANYGATDVPVPSTIGVVGTQVQLVQ
ncbi:pilus assembly protein TadG-related protein [Phreatobacter sp.]|uniref:TadE/TadG family type IV pilus assembly protein n=1 Tax=Phreatobacter sp. TaxID=1966341 RepID=UPI0025CE17D4|nr:pilus assembly protein TadG-related protein [Phreatobacter sp.]